MAEPFDFSQEEFTLQYGDPYKIVGKCGKIIQETGPLGSPTWFKIPVTEYTITIDTSQEGNTMHDNLILEPTVQLIGSTGSTYALDDYMEVDWDSSDSEDIMEFAGRACYQSFDKPNPATKSNKDYLANIIEQGHESVLEHAQYTFYIQGVSRTLTHELVRHRHLGYSQMSQRYVDESDAKFVVPPRYRDDEEMLEFFSEYQKEITSLYGTMVKDLQENGVPRKKAREAARSILPGSTETKIVVSGNCRAWRDFLKKRMHPAADAEIQRLALAIFRTLHARVSNVFDDLVPMAQEIS